MALMLLLRDAAAATYAMRRELRVDAPARRCRLFFMSRLSMMLLVTIMLFADAIDRYYFDSAPADTP